MRDFIKLLQYFVFVFSFISISYAQQKQDSIAFKQVDAFLAKDDKAKALQLALRRLDSANTIHNIGSQIDWNIKIGKIFRIDNFKKAMGYYTQAEKLSKHSKDSVQMANLYFEIGSVSLQKYAKDVYKAQDIAVSQEVKNTALRYLLDVLKYFQNMKGTEAIIAKTYANLTGLYSYTGNQKEVEALASKAMHYFIKQKDTIGLVGVKSNLGINQMYQGQLQKAAQNYLDALPYLKDTTNLVILNLKSTNFDNLSQVYEKQGKHKLSREYLYKAHQLHLIYLEKTKVKEFVEIESKYNLDVGLANEVSKTLKLKVQKEKLYNRLIVTSLLGVSAVLFALFLYRNNKLRSIKKELKYQQDIQLLQHKNQSKLVNATLDGRLKERQQISQVLHDSVSALLSSANMHLQVVKKKCSNSVEELQKTQQILDEALNKIRNLSQQLVPPVLVKFGLISAIEDLCEKHSNADLQFRLKYNDKTAVFNPELESKIFNILQESVNNILKHSKATKAIITLKTTPNQLAIEVFDNGVGFSPDLHTHRNGVGLHQIKARVEVLNGNLTIYSKPNQYTQIKINIPTSIRN